MPMSFSWQRTSENLEEESEEQATAPCHAPVVNVSVSTTGKVDGPAPLVYVAVSVGCEKPMSASAGVVEETPSSPEPKKGYEPSDSTESAKPRDSSSKDVSKSSASTMLDQRELRRMTLEKSIAEPLHQRGIAKLGQLFRQVGNGSCFQRKSCHQCFRKDVGACSDIMICGECGPFEDHNQVGDLDFNGVLHKNVKCIHAVRIRRKMRACKACW